MDFPNNLLNGAQAPIVSHQADCMAQYDPLIPCNCNESVSIETLLAEQEGLNLDSNMLNHPLFQHANDGLLSKFINILNALSSAKETVPGILEDIQKFTHEAIFGKKSLEELKEEFQSLGLVQKWTCQKPIKENEICFRCLDCETDNHPNFYYVICAECFEKSSHEGHRLVMLKHPATVEISCNCGSPEAFKPEGFCPDHKYADVNMKDILNKFPEEIVKRFIETMNKVFYGTMCLMELVYYLKEKPGFKPIKMLFQLVTIQTATFVESLTSQIGSSILAIVDSVLRDSFRSPCNKLWHDCNDFSGEQKGPADPTQHRECSCTILGSLFKCGKYMENQDQIIISKIVAQSLDDLPFREFFALEFAKYTRFYFPQMLMENSVIIKGNAKILEYNNMIWCMEDLLELVVKNKYLNQYMGVLQTTVETYTSLTEGIVETLSFLADVWSFYFNPNNAKTAPLVRKEIQETTITSEFLQHMMTFQMKFFYPDRIGIEMQFEEIDYGFINNSQVMSLCMTYGLNYALKMIEILPKEEKTPLLKRLMGDWYQFYLTVNLVLVDDTYFQSLTPLLERALYSIIRCYTSDFTKENVEEFFRECLPEVEIGELARLIIKSLMKVLGLMRYINIVHHKQTGPFVEGYYQLDFTIFETDMSLVHLMGMFVNPQDLLALLARNYFSFDEKLQQGEEDFGEILLRTFEDPSHEYKKERTMMVEDFLSFLVFIMNDDTSQLNLNMNDKYNRKNIKNPDLEKVLEKVTVNFLLTQYWTDIAYFNDLLFGLVFGEEAMDPIILKLTIKDEKTHRIRIKEGYEKEIDPYIFYKNAIVLRDLQTELNNRYRNSETVDLVSGKFYEDLLPQVRTFQKAIYQGLLPQTLSKLVSQKTLSKEVLSFIRIVLKLILLNLQSVDDSLNGNASEAEIEEMKKRIQENYLNEAFSEGLVRLKKLPAFKDCIRCIGKITDLIKSLSSEFNQEGLPEAMTGLTKQESVREDKKKAALERMNKLKEEFAKKQSQFTDKNKELVAGAGEESKTGSPDVQEKRGKTCQHCLDTIDAENQFYGVPIHVSFTNNFYQVDETENLFPAKTYENFSAIDWWPVLSSCHHYYHTKCIISNLKSVNQAHLLYQNFYSNPFENHCSLCKTLYNSFLVLNQENEAAKAAYEAETLDPVERVIGRSIVPVQINKIFTILKTTLSQKNQPSLAENEQVEIIEIFRRAFDYFMESFRFCQDSKTAEKTLALYVSFFKTLGSYFGGHYFKGLQWDVSFLAILERETGYGYFNWQTDVWLCILSFANTFGTLIDEREAKEKQLLVSHTKILVEYIQYKTVQFLACLDENRPTDLAECCKLLQNKPEMKKGILEKFAHPIHKILLGTFANKWIASAKGLPTSSSFYKIISKPNKEPTTEALDEFMKLIGFEEDLSTLFDRATSELKIAPIQAHLAVLLKVLQSDVSKEQRSTRVRKLAPRMIKLPETYAEYNAKYFKRKCCLCKKYSNHMFTYICLICDEVFCQGFCPPHRNQVGNMNSHCRKVHFGKSVFLDMFQPMVNIINFPINGIQPVVNIYTDPMGVPIQQALGRHLDLLTLDFKKFTLNPALVEEIERMVLNQNIDNECFRMLINYPPEDQIPPHNEL